MHSLLFGAHQKSNEEEDKLVGIHTFITVGVDDVADALADEKWHV
jgi:hypothetical protein